MGMNRSIQRLAALGLLLALLWAAIHPAVINAFPRNTHQILFCATNGMTWVDTRTLDYPPIELVMAQAESQALDAAGSGPEKIIFSCPWCQHAVTLESAAPPLQTVLGIYSPWHDYALSWTASASTVPKAQPLYQLPLNRAPPLA